MNPKQRKFMAWIVPLSLLLAFPASVGAMHIMEGYLPMSNAIAWGALCIPFLAAGFFSIRKTLTENRRLILIFAMAGAFSFVLSALKIPSVTGSSSHMTGTGLGAILFGPATMSILGVIVLLFQALMLAHGGLTTLGANTFSMAVAGPFAAFGVYKLLLKLRIPKYGAIFFAALAGDLITYCITSFQLGFAYPAAEGGIAASLVKFLGIFAVTQVPLAIIEGLLTVMVIMGLESYAPRELKSLGIVKGGPYHVKH